MLFGYLLRQREFSEQTFGPGRRTEMVVAHIRKELAEIEREPTDLMEWIDVVMLALDGAWRCGFDTERPHGFDPAVIMTALEEKLAQNRRRRWPDWRTCDPNQPIEHERT